MAKAEAVRPAGPREKNLYDLVDAKFASNNAEFFRQLARLTGLTPATEKSAFYRIVRGEGGRRVEWRLRNYATVLGIPSKAFLAAWGEDEEEAAERNGLPPRLSPREVRDVLLEVIDRVDRLVDRVEDLERRVPAKRRRGGTS